MNCFFVPPRKKAKPRFCPGFSFGREAAPAVPAGFTLTELLVAIAVLGALAALLVPAVGSATRAADKRRCVEHLRQLSVATHSYVSEHDGYLPSGWNPMEGTIVKALTPYLAPMKSATVAADVFYCPANERLDSPPAEGFLQAGGKRYKGFAGYFIGYLINGGIHPIQGLPEEGKPEPIYRYRITQVLIPAKTVSLLDLITRKPGVTAPPSSGLGRNYYFNPKDKNFALGLVHNGKGNVLFIDGHVEAFDDSRPLPVQSLPGRDTTWWP